MCDAAKAPPVQLSRVSTLTSLAPLAGCGFSGNAAAEHSHVVDIEPDPALVVAAVRVDDHFERAPGHLVELDPAQIRAVVPGGRVRPVAVVLRPARLVAQVLPQAPAVAAAVDDQVGAVPRRNIVHRPIDDQVRNVGADLGVRAEGRQNVRVVRIHEVQRQNAGPGARLGVDVEAGLVQGHAVDVAVASVGAAGHGPAVHVMFPVADDDVGALARIDHGADDLDVVDVELDHRGGVHVRDQQELEPRDGVVRSGDLGRHGVGSTHVSV